MSEMPPDPVMRLYKSFRFEAAHFLPHTDETHKCHRLHGHSYKFELWVCGTVNPEMGWVIDLGDIDVVGQSIRAELDHRLLNDIAGLENPTCEVLAMWIAKKAVVALPLLVKVVINETANSGCVYELPPT